MRYGAVVGLQGLQTATAIQQPSWWQTGVKRLEEITQQDDTLAVRARAKLALDVLER